MQSIHPTAIIHASAVLGSNTQIGPYCVVGEGVVLGDNCFLKSHVVIEGPSIWGDSNIIHPFATVGVATPDVKYQGEHTTLTVGSGNVIREGVTLHRGTIQDRGDTSIGDNNLFLPYAHVGHDCVIGNHTVFVNNATLAGHVMVCDWAIIGGYSCVNQYSVIGAHCFIAGMVRVKQDVPAYVIIGGSGSPVSINKEGLKRRGFSQESIRMINKAYKILYRSELSLERAIVEIEKLASQDSHIKLLLDSLKNSKRGIMR